MKVVLLSHTPEPEKLVAAAARLCYSSVGAEALKDRLDDDKIQSFLRMLTEMGHLSPVEHVSFTFAIEGVSRALSHQLVRHRIASYSQQSQRYVKETQFDYIMPPAIAAHDEARTIFIKHMEASQEAYNQLLRFAHREDARYVLPNACETKLVSTMNARSLYNFFEHRLCIRAQWEIRQLAALMLAAVREVAPNLFAHVGPTCVTEGVCYEGEKSCGRAPLAKRRPDA